MNLAVKFWLSETNKPVGMPDAWPCEVKELGESTTLPEGNYSLMSLSEYVAYRAQHRAAYDIWAATQE